MDWGDGRLETMRGAAVCGPQRKRTEKEAMRGFCYLSLFVFCLLISLALKAPIPRAVLSEGGIQLSTPFQHVLLEAYRGANCGHYRLVGKTD